MRLHPVWGLILFFLAALATSSLAYGGELPGGTPKGFERQELEGFTVYVNKKVLQVSRDHWNRPPLTVLERELNDLRRILVPKIVRVLQDVPIWVEWDENSKVAPGAVAVYYHGDAEGMKSMGIDPRKANCIEILTLRRLGEMRHPGTPLQQIVILHEMAHAVHHRLLGTDNPELAATFQQAVDRKLYDSVNDRYGRKTKAYARTNAAEYFAEISCAYLDSCNYFPFNYTQLRGYDPAGFAFVERVWKHPERFSVIASKSSSRSGKPSGVASASRPSVYAERDAQLKLDKLRAQVKDSPASQVRKGLTDLVRNYPDTAAADEARQMLGTSK
jgi:hypothetical protein